MATQFTSAEWRRIREKLEAAPEWWGLPKGSTAPCSLAPSASVSWDRLEAATSIRGSSWPTSAAASTCWPSRRSWTTPQRLAAVAVAARAGVQHGGFGPDRRVPRRAGGGREAGVHLPMEHGGAHGGGQRRHNARDPAFGDGDRKRDGVSCRWLRATRPPVGR